MKILNHEILISPAWRKGLLRGFIGLCALASLVFAYKVFSHKAPLTGVYTSPPPAKGATTVPTKDVLLKVSLKAHDKKKVGPKMGLPPEVIDDPKKELVATGRVKPSEGGYTLAAITDTSTGVTTLETKEEPRPIFGFLGKSSVGALAGITTKGPAAVLYVSQDLLRVGPIHLGAASGAGTMGSEFVAGAFVNVSGSW